MSQPIDLDELTRLHNASLTSVFTTAELWKFRDAFKDSFPALRDELVRLREQNGNLAASLIKSAEDYVAMRELDKANQVLLGRLTAQLDEAKFAFQAIEIYDGPGFPHGTCANLARAFLDSLAGESRQDNPPKEIKYTGHVPCRKCGTTHWMHGDCPTDQQQQPTQGEVKS